MMIPMPGSADWQIADAARTIILLSSGGRSAARPRNNCQAVSSFFNSTIGQRGCNKFWSLRLIFSLCQLVKLVLQACNWSPSASRLLRPVIQTPSVWSLNSLCAQTAIINFCNHSSLFRIYRPCFKPTNNAWRRTPLPIKALTPCT